MKSNIEQKSLEPSGELASSIRDFRAVVTHVAERETARPVSAGWLTPARQRRKRAQLNMALAWACAALLCLAMLPLSVRSHPAPIHAVITTAAAAPAPESDSALLEQVDTNVDQSVPAPLAPLADLETWSSTSATTSDGSSVNGTSSAHMEKTNVAR